MNRRWLATFALSLPLVLGSCATLDASPKRVDFGRVLVGTSSAARSVEWTNGHTAPVTVTGVTLAPAAGFVRTPPIPNPVALAVNAKHKSTYVFTPQAAGTYRASTTPTLAQVGVTATNVALSGIGANWHIEGSRELSLQDGDLVGVLTNNRPMDFGRWPVGTRSNPVKRFRVRNRSHTRAITVTLAWADGTRGFAHNQAQALVLQPRKRKWIDLTFTPVAVGAAQDTLLVTATAGGAQISSGGFVVTGTGVAAGGGGGGDGGGDEGDGH